MRSVSYYKYMSVKSLAALLIFFLLLIFSSVTIFESVDALVLVSFYINAIVLSVLIVRSLRNVSFSLEFIHHFFMLYMLTFAPLMQYATTKTFLWVKVSTGNIIVINLILLIWTLTFQLGRSTSRTPSINEESINHYGYSIPSKAEITTSLVMIIFVASGLLSRGVRVYRNEAVKTTFVGTGLYVLFFAIRMGIVITANSISIYRFKYSKRISVFLIINLIACLLIAFPTSIPRFMAATIYGGIILMFSDKLKKNKLYPAALLVGFMILFPLLSHFRYARTNINIIQILKQIVSSLKSEYNSGNYDGYMMLYRTLQYVKEQGITFGKSLLGNILFFIPRSLWRSKPVGSGAMITGYLNYRFTNYSESLPAEAYLNFGPLGILIYPFFLGRITKRIDHIYWAKPQMLFFQLTYTFYVHIFLILLRGDFMTGFLYIFILTLVNLACHRLLGINRQLTFEE